ncbi:aldehyde dehydrogenase [Rhodanobacter thiooxydans]|uniref:Aldehyde dehydrogenase n=1 Tax=Rhodanobacter thiooxydans TaxID=416169 RepID=A0A154QGP5_9GAMM|nr:coniferyl aldehyde dehydrogenase [Rhodanobacter thiooxydans]EIL98874.1 coniferyl aldehyde dehydrogenase (caldh) [Rhodanobacter thiooxydans LCS2]KZC23327.1 aldehyde dehydrogenase [Rhodanobacter thiooxydans]MCW0201203.1 coniferyl aldehyde dehydrogenase [Rhodanobacter thiooxydans]
MHDATNTDLAGMLQRLRDAQAREPMPGWPRRAQRLRQLEKMLLEQRAAFAAAIDADFGQRPAEETDLLEVFPSLSAVRHALRHGRRWMRPRRSLAGLAFLPARNVLIPQPRGVVGIIVPWNYPLYLAIGPLVDALVAGNRAMLKMSEFTPRFSGLFAEQVAKYFQPDEVVVVNGDAEVAQAFSTLPFDHLLFTGSTAVGHHVMRAAAANLTPVTLELGGKSPAIIGPGARLEHAVERIVFGKLVNAGQTCIAPDYVLLPRARVAEFIELAGKATTRMYPRLERNTQYASIVSDRQYQRLAALRDGALAAGARTHPLGEATEDPARRLLPPQLLTEVDDSMAVMREEIFGPLLPLLPYDSLDDAITYIAARPHPLALYLFEHDQARIDLVLARTHAGGVGVNDTLFQIAQHELPFGGVGASGMGGYHGEAGFRTFSHFKPVFRQARWNGAGLLNPPYGARFRRMLALLLRRG